MSVSLPDELKEQLDSCAEENDLKRSAAVAQILETFFTDEEQDPHSADPRINEIDEELDQVQSYLAQLHERDPEYYPKPPWLEKPRRSGRSFLGQQ